MLSNHLAGGVSMRLVSGYFMGSKVLECFFHSISFIYSSHSFLWAIVYLMGP